MGEDIGHPRPANAAFAFDVDIASLPTTRSSSWQRLAYAHNQAYSPIGYTSPELIREIASLETRLIDSFEGVGIDDDIAGIEIEEEFVESLPSGTPPLDLGVCAATLTLSLLGCVTVSSCNGGAFNSYHQEDHPLIAFYCDQSTLTRIIPVLCRFRVGLADFGDCCLVLSTKDIREFIQLSEALLLDIQP